MRFDTVNDNDTDMGIQSPFKPSNACNALLYTPRYKIGFDLPQTEQGLGREPRAKLGQNRHMCS